MKELVKIKASSEKIRRSELIHAAITHIVAAVIGFFTSRAVVFGSQLPFGLSLMAGCSLTYMPSVAVGVFAGYFIPAVGGGAFRYIAAMLAILTIKLLLSGYKKLVSSPLFLGFICLLSNVLTSAVTLSGQPSEIIDIISETVLSAGATFFICRTSRALKRLEVGLSADELAGLLIVISILITGISRITLYEVSLGRVLSVCLILVCSKYGGIVSGAIGAIAMSFSASLTGASGVIVTSYALGGLLSGVFRTFGRYAQIAAISAACFICAAAEGFLTPIASVLVELILGSALFITLPRNLGIELSKVFSGSPRVTSPTGTKKALTMRLNLASSALCDVSKTVEQVSAELSRINSPDFSQVLSKIENDSCSGCSRRIHCWEHKRDDTVAAILEMTKAVKAGELMPASQAPEEFKGRCVRVPRMGEAVFKHYSDYASKMAAESRIDEVRSVVSDQFEGISDMLCDLAADFDSDERFDNSAAIAAAASLKNLDIRIDECCSRIDRFGRMTLELKLKRNKETVLNRLHIMKMLSLACERNFDVPNISEVGNDIYITVSEHAAFSIDIGVSQSGANGASLCGDAYNYFNDGKGHFVMVLSDGMGTGGRAAVDSAMASGLMSRLLKAGFGYDCSLRILNSSMLFKSTDESLATMDIASIDLYTGMLELYKAGAAPTLVRRTGSAGKAESTSLPIGILREIGFDKAAIRMKIGDIVLIMSDGASADGTDWIRDELEAWRDGSAEALADHICNCARRRHRDRREDDITVMAAIIEKAV